MSAPANPWCEPDPPLSPDEARALTTEIARTVVSALDHDPDMRLWQLGGFTVHQDAERIEVFTRTPVESELGMPGSSLFLEIDRQLLRRGDVNVCM